MARLVSPSQFLINMEDRKYYCYVISLFCLLFFSAPLLAQKSKAQLEKEKKEILERIQQNEKILAQTASKKRSTMGSLNALNSQIESQQKLINSVNQEVRLLNSQISEIAMIIESLEDDLQGLKEEYASMLYAAQKTSGGLDKLVFLFASKNFNQLLMRLKYMEYYAEVRSNQLKQIEAVRATLISQRNDVEYKRSEQQELLQEQVARNIELQRLKDEQNEMVARLASKEKEIRKDIEKRKSAVANLENLIADIIKKEIEKSKAAAGSKSTSKDARIGLTPEEKLISENFEGNKRRLIWPVGAGFISQRFGTHPHPVFKNIQEKNDGVDIQTNNDEPVRAIFAGTVIRVSAVPSFGMAVIIQHGEYLTVYANLKSVKVKSMQKIDVKDQIGVVATDKDGVSTLQFQIWKNAVKLNPEDWLAKK